MLYSVNEIINLTNQKRGTVESFRDELLSQEIIKNNQSLDDRAFQVFKNSIKYKNSEDNTTWKIAMKKAIQQEYGAELKLPFRWTSSIIVQDIIWNINNNNISVEDINELSNDKNEYHILFEVMIDNFKELGKDYDDYIDSFGTDCNGNLTFKCSGEDYSYYILGKWNHITKEEDIHVFFNEGKNFNIMRCKHICGGSAEKGILKELKDTCNHKSIEMKKKGEIKND